MGDTLSTFSKSVADVVMTQFSLSNAEGRAGLDRRQTKNTVHVHREVAAVVTASSYCRLSPDFWLCQDSTALFC